MSKQKYRILYIEKTSGGGSTLSLFELVKALDKDLFEPIILFIQKNDYCKRFKDIGLKTYNLDNQNKKKKIRKKRDIGKALNKYGTWLAKLYFETKQLYVFFKIDIFDCFRIKKIIKEIHPAIIHHNTTLPGNRATILSGRILNMPQVCHVRGFNKLSIVEKFISKYIDRFIYISKAIEKSYLDQGISKEKGSVIYNPVNEKLFNNYNKSKIVFDLRSEFGITVKDRLICNIGRLDWWKGQDIFLKAVAKLITFDPKIKVLIVGSEETSSRCQDYYKKLRTLVKELKISNSVFFTGERHDIPIIMAASDIVVHSASEPEPFGRVVVEGMMAGRPVVATAGGGILDIIEDKITGLLVPMMDANAMAKAINYLLRSEKDAQQIGLRAQLFAKNKFNVRKHVKAIQNIYRNIIEIDSL